MIVGPTHSLFTFHLSHLPFFPTNHRPPLLLRLSHRRHPPYLHPIYRRRPSPHPSPPPLSLPPTSADQSGEALGATLEWRRVLLDDGARAERRPKQRRRGVEQRCPRGGCGGGGRLQRRARQRRTPRQAATTPRGAQRRTPLMRARRRRKRGGVGGR